MGQSPPGAVNAVVRCRLDPLREGPVGSSRVPARGRHEHVRHSSGKSSWSSTITAGRSSALVAGTRQDRRPHDGASDEPTRLRSPSGVPISPSSSHACACPARWPTIRSPSARIASHRRRSPRPGGDLPDERAQPRTLLAGGRLQSFPVVLAAIGSCAFRPDAQGCDTHVCQFPPTCPQADSSSVPQQAAGSSLSWYGCRSESRRAQSSTPISCRAVRAVRGHGELHGPRLGPCTPGATGGAAFLDADAPVGRPEGRPTLCCSAFAGSTSPWRSRRWTSRR